MLLQFIHGFLHDTPPCATQCAAEEKGNQESGVAPGSAALSIANSSASAGLGDVAQLWDFSPGLRWDLASEASKIRMRRLLRVCGALRLPWC